MQKAVNVSSALTFVRLTDEKYTQISHELLYFSKGEAIRSRRLRCSRYAENLAAVAEGVTEKPGVLPNDMPRNWASVGSLHKAFW